MADATIDRVKNLHELTKRLIIMTGVALLIMVGIFAATFLFTERFMLTWIAFICGIIGGFVSIQQRIKHVSNEELSLLCGSWLQILLIPIFGGVFALVLYLIFLSEIVNGGLFPDFYVPPPPASNVITTDYILSVLKKTYPASGQDLAKFLFWSFVAGFSERFVPQIISKVTSEANPD